MLIQLVRVIAIATCISNSLANNLFLPTKTKLTWINGIGFNLDHMQHGQQSLSYIFGRPISYYHNPTAMANEEDKFGYINDLAQAGQHKLGRITAEVDELYIHLKDAIESVGPKGRVIHIAHSQGALITSLAVKRLTKMEMSQLEIICFGGAEALQVTPDFPFARCVNYYSVNDPLLFLVPQAARALRTGFMGTECSGEALAKMAANTEPEFVFLSPRAGDPILDHGLFGPTYLDALKWEGRRYKTLYLPGWYNAMTIALAYGETMGTGIVEACFNFVMYILEQTLLRFVRFVQCVNSIVHKEIILPIAQVLFVLFIKLKELIRKIKKEDLYEPVNVVRDENYADRPLN